MCVLETPRLVLRHFLPSDLDALYAVIGDRLTMQYYPGSFERKDARAWIERNQMRYVETGHGLYAVVLKRTGEMIGDCGLVRQQVEGDALMEVGYHLRRDQWGQGYATEAARACMDYGFRTWQPDKIISLIRPENLPSRRVAERNGMHVERQVTYYDLPHLVYSITRDNYGKA